MLNKNDVVTLEITALTNEGSGATVTMTVNGETVSAVCGGGRITYTPAADMDDGRVSVTVTVTPDKGYELDTITVKDASGNTVKLIDKGNLIPFH